MTESPKISVVVPTRGRSEALHRCLGSLGRQTLAPSLFEVVVVDDGSEPPVNVPSELPAGGARVCLLRQAPSGPAAARNRGVAEARGEFVGFIDDDCEPAPQWLSSLVVVLEQNRGAAAGGSVVNALRDNPFAEASQDVVSFICAYYNQRPSDARFLTSNNLAFPRQLLIDAGAFNVDYHRAAAEDRELCDRWRSRGQRIVFVPHALVHHAHDLTLVSFWQQHFSYGIGARHFRAARAARGMGGVRIEPLRFYWGLLTFPLRRRGIAGVGQSVLVALAQTANAAGFLYETTRERWRVPISAPTLSR